MIIRGNGGVIQECCGKYAMKYAIILDYSGRGVRDLKTEECYILIAAIKCVG